MTKKINSRIYLLLLALIIVAMTMTDIQADTENEENGVVEVKEVLPLREEAEIAPGVKYIVRRDIANLAGERLHVHITEVDQTVVDTELKLVYAGEELGDTQTLSSIANNYGAVAAINGGFYSNQNGRRMPVGNFMVDGELLSESDFYRASMGITVDDEILFGYFNSKENGFDWDNLVHMLTGGPMLVSEGQPVFQAIAEGFTGSVLSPNPRSAVGMKADGVVMLVVAEREVPGGRVGLTLEEMAILMAQLGAYEAMGLDSGGSSTMWAGDKVVNHAARSERAIANALVVLRGPKIYLNAQRIYPDVPPQLVGGRTLVPIRVLMEKLGARVDWKAETRSVYITRGNEEIVLEIGSNVALVNGNEHILDVSAETVNGRTMVPVRFVTEALNGFVNWDGDKRRIDLYLR